MAGRGHMPHQPFDDGRHGYPEGPFVRGPVPRQPHAALFEEHERRRHEIVHLEHENLLLARDRCIFQNELYALRQELHRRTVALTEIRAKKEAHLKELVKKGLKQEAYLRAADPLRKDVVQLRAGVQKLNAVRQELNSQIWNLSQELTRAQADNQQIHAMRTGCLQQLVRARTALESAKKVTAELVEQVKGIKKKLISMTSEVERLHADLSNSDVRPWGVVGAYGMKLGSPDAPFSPSYGDGFGIHQGVPEKVPMYGALSGSWGA